jgi:hypothetical protein
MFTNLYCVVSSAAWISKVDVPQYWNGVYTGYKVDDVVHRSAAFDIVSRRGADKNGIVVDRSEGNAHYFRPLVEDVIRPSFSSCGTDGADIEIEVYRWTGDEATATKFKPLGDVYLSLAYPQRGDGQGLGFGTDDKLLVLADAFPEWHSGPKYGPTIEELTGKPSKYEESEYEDKILEHRPWNNLSRLWRP